MRTNSVSLSSKLSIFSEFERIFFILTGACALCGFILNPYFSSVNSKMYTFYIFVILNNGQKNTNVLILTNFYFVFFYPFLHHKSFRFTYRKTMLE